MQCLPGMTHTETGQTEARHPMGTSPSTRLVAIGISADGITSLDTLLGGFPADFPSPVLLVLHRGPAGKSALERILGKRSMLPVKEPASGDLLQPGVVYVAPADVHLTVTHGRIELTRAPKVGFSRPSIDVLFDSVAKVSGDGAIGVLLSGYGRDGVKGLQAIKAAGGTTIVQDPGDTRYRKLPSAAIAEDGIDLVLPLRHIASALTRLVVSQLPPRLKGPVSGAMTTKVVMVFDDLPVSAARTVATRYDYDAFPVVARDGRLVGVISKGDLLRAAIAALHNPNTWSESVRRWMAHGILALRPTDSLGAAVEYLLASHFHSLPVIDTDSRVVGMVSRHDVMKAIAPTLD